MQGPPDELDELTVTVVPELLEVELMAEVDAEEDVVPVDGAVEPVEATVEP